MRRRYRKRLFRYTSLSGAIFILTLFLALIIFMIPDFWTFVFSSGSADGGGEAFLNDSGYTIKSIYDSEG